MLGRMETTSCPFAFLPERTRGFTLVELAIVLVVIGLIIGGVLVGAELIKNAEIRATIGQLEKFNAAAGAFRLKYNCLPGDCATATNYGLSGHDFSGGGFPPPVGNNGDGNGFVFGTCCAGNINPSATGNEGWNFWVHLSQAGLIADGYSTAHAWEPTVGTHSPATMLKKGGWWIAGGPLANGNNASGLNFPAHAFLIAAQLYVGASAAGVLTPLEASAIDVKLDDGIPTEGNVEAILGNINNPWGLYYAAHGACINVAANPDVYWLSSSNNVCNLVIKASF